MPDLEDGLEGKENVVGETRGIRVLCVCGSVSFCDGEGWDDGGIIGVDS